MLYIYTDQESVIDLVKDIPNIKIIKRTSKRWLEDFDIAQNDKILFIAKRTLGSIRHSKNLIGSLKGYKLVGNKIAARVFFFKKGISTPKTYYFLSRAKYPFIARPNRHSTNSNFYIIRNHDEMVEFRNLPIYQRRNWYYSELIDVHKEYRVMIMDGEVFLVYNRMLGNTIQETLDIRNEARATNSLVRYECGSEVSNENIQLCLDAMKAVNLGYGAVDLIVDKEGKGYIVEINNKPFLHGELVQEAFKAAVIKLAKKYGDDV